MDPMTGDIYPHPNDFMNSKLMKQMRSLSFLPGPDPSGDQPPVIEMELPPTKRQLARKPFNPNAIGRVGRNEACPCGSGKKFKFCHLNV